MEAAAAQQLQQQQGGSQGEAPEPQPKSAGAPPPPFGFPTGLVKRLVVMDEEVARVSADAVRAVAKATELFVQQLAARALEHAQAGKRKNFKLPDLLHVAGRDRCAEKAGHCVSPCLLLCCAVPAVRPTTTDTPPRPPFTPPPPHPSTGGSSTWGCGRCWKT